MKENWLYSKEFRNFLQENVQVVYKHKYTQWGFLFTLCRDNECNDWAALRHVNVFHFWVPRLIRWNSSSYPQITQLCAVAQPDIADLFYMQGADYAQQAVLEDTQSETAIGDCVNMLLKYMDSCFYCNLQ